MDLLVDVNHEPTMVAIHAERAMLKTLDGSCRAPIGAYATIQGDHLLHLVGYYESADGKRTMAERVGSIEEPEELGRELGVSLLERA
jgi:hydroxymethylbilane synthase